jgi:hypothetical protein
VDPDLPDLWTYLNYGLPVCRLQSLLHTPKLEAGYSASLLGESPDLIPGGPEPEERAYPLGTSIQVFVF